MLTVFTLCAEMENSGRPIERRTVREWWVRGLLPKPTRRRFGYGLGTETFWTEKRVLGQAQTAYDLFHRPRKRVFAHEVLIRLWLLNFPISPDVAKAAFLKRLTKHLNKLRIPSGDFEDGAWTLATRVTRDIGEARQVPIQICRGMTDLLTEIFSLFVGSQEEDTLDDLAPLWEQVGPYMIQGSNSVPVKVEKVQWETFVELLPFFRRNASLPAQIAAMTRATRHDFETMHRLMRLVTVILKRASLTFADVDCSGEEHILTVILLCFGPTILPVLFASMQDVTVRCAVIRAVLDMLGRLRDPVFVAQIATSRRMR